MTATLSHRASEKVMQKTAESAAAQAEKWTPASGGAGDQGLMVNKMLELARAEGHTPKTAEESPLKSLDQVVRKRKKVHTALIDAKGMCTKDIAVLFGWSTNLAHATMTAMERDGYVDRSQTGRGPIVWIAKGNTSAIKPPRIGAISKPKGKEDLKPIIAKALESGGKTSAEIAKAIGRCTEKARGQLRVMERHGIITKSQARQNAPIMWELAK